MNRIAATFLLIAMCLLTLGCLFGKLTPAAWILMYAGWLFLAQNQGQRMLAEIRERK
jgi:hypothetical protein